MISQIYKQYATSYSGHRKKSTPECTHQRQVSNKADQIHVKLKQWVRSLQDEKNKTCLYD